MNTNACEILKVYLGASDSGGYLPYGHEQRMSAAYGASAEAMVVEVRKYLEAERASFEAPTDLGQEQKAFEVELAQRFPELDAVAVHALSSRWSYSWR